MLESLLPERSQVITDLCGRPVVQYQPVTEVTGHYRPLWSARRTVSACHRGHRSLPPPVVGPSYSLSLSQRSQVITDPCGRPVVQYQPVTEVTGHYRPLWSARRTVSACHRGHRSIPTPVVGPSYSISLSQRSQVITDPCGRPVVQYQPVTEVTGHYRPLWSARRTVSACHRGHRSLPTPVVGPSYSISLSQRSQVITNPCGRPVVQYQPVTEVTGHYRPLWSARRTVSACHRGHRSLPTPVVGPSYSLSLSQRSQVITDPCGRPVVQYQPVIQ
ncbi:hypothetical protein ACOMHN_046960 [Nucella lapillus]